MFATQEALAKIRGLEMLVAVPFAGWLIEKLASQPASQNNAKIFSARSRAYRAKFPEQFQKRIRNSQHTLGIAG